MVTMAQVMAEWFRRWMNEQPRSVRDGLRLTPEEYGRMAAADYRRVLDDLRAQEGRR